VNYLVGGALLLAFTGLLLGILAEMREKQERRRLGRRPPRGRAMRVILRALVRGQGKDKSLWM
jgi:hypothetical protein